jgi:predicted dehydrogenase
MTINKKDKISVALIGAGRMGRRHLHAVRKLNLPICGVVDQSATALKEVQVEQGLSENQLYLNQEQLYISGIPECVIIATTADSHCDLVCHAAERGVKYILVEKPLAVSLEECQKMIDTCRRYGAKLAVNHQMRFMEQYTKPKELLSSPAYGGLKSMTVIAGNFGVAMNGTHYFEAFRFMADEEPIEVSAWFSSDVVPNPRGPQFEDRAGSIRVQTKSGKRLYLEIGSDQGHGLQVIYAARTGIVTINEFSGEMTSSVRKSEYTDLPTTRYGMPAENSREFIAAAEVIDSTAQVLNALLCDDPNNVIAEHGMMATRVLVAAYVSAENGGQPVRIDSHLDYKRIFPWA